MKRHLLLFILLLTLGVGWSKAQNTNVGSGPYEFTLGTGTGTVNYLPLRNSVQYTLSQQLYLASEIVEAGMTNKPVGSISFYSVGNVGCNLKGTKIWMANVSGSAVSATSPLASGMTLVYDGEQIQVDGWNEFQLNGDFAWDGTSNILVLFQSNRGSTGSDIYWQYTTDLGFNASAFATGFYNPFNPEGATYNMGTPYNYRVNTKFKSFVGIPSPRGLEVSDVTTNSANLSWTARGGETGWNVRYRVSGDENAWTEVTGLNADVTSYSITGLQENTTYEVQLSSVLGEEVSNWTSSFTFRTYLGVTIPDVATFVTFRDGINSGTSFTLSDMTIPAGGETVMFILGDNLDLSSVCGLDVNGGTSWTPIGNTSSKPFKGAFDGNGKTISGLYVNSDDGNNKGLFGYVTNGSIQNLTLEGSINASCSYIGSVCAYLTNGTISGCCNKVQIMASASFGYTNVGGICGWGTKSIITNCVNEGTLEGMYVGGICCNNNNGFISNCSNKADLHARFGAGVCYQNYSGSEISYCYNTGNLSSSATGSESVCLTGIVNQNDGAVSHCFNLGDLSATQTTNSALCGLSDVNNGSIANCYNMGLLAGYVVYGGVRSCGYASTTANCYSAGTLKGIYSSYGFSNSSSGTNCYFDNQMTLASDAYGTGKSTALMTSGSLFSDADNWEETEGLYPRINGLETTEAALVAASPVLLETSEIYNNVESTFTLGRADDDIVWTADNDLVTIGDGGICTINGIGDVTLNCALNDVSRNVTLHVIKLWEGEGTEVSPYLITSKADMENLAGMVNDGTDYQGVYFTVTSDIDLECDASHPWTPIGNSTISFKGHFDGDSHVISNMVITNANGQYQGLFGCTTNAEISNLTVAGSMTGDDYTAGVVGCMFGGRVYNCINNVTCSAGNFIAGICGTLKENGILENCINAADLTAAQPGGICQNCNDNSQILNCRNDGDITKTGTNEDYGAGGICQINYGTISNCCNTGSVSGNNYVGGICGYNYNKIEKCYNLGLVEGNQWVGGICGYEEYNGYRNCYVEYCVNVGEVHANYYYGGVVGTMKGRSNSYRAYCTNCINIAPVIEIPDNTNTGGVIGQFYNSYYTVNNCYYDKQMCTIEDNSWGYPHGVSLSTAEMTSGNLFNNSNWVETSGLYPRIAGMDDTDAALVVASPVFLGGFDTSFVMGGFSVGKADEDVAWTASNNIVSIGSDGSCTINGNGDVTLTCTLNGISKSVTLHVEESPWEGAGTQDNPYEISNAQELSALSSMVDEGMSFKDTYFIMTNDIDLSAVCGAGMGENDENINWMPIGLGYYWNYEEETYKETYFSGHFDGGFHTVSNLYINDTEYDHEYNGLFGMVKQGSISNLAVMGYVHGDAKAAGICANLYGGNISRCHNAVTVEGNVAGGIVATFRNDDNEVYAISDCYNTGAVTADSRAGGICGELSNYGTWSEDDEYIYFCRIFNCYNSGFVLGGNAGAISCAEFVDKGGDRSESGNVVNCYYDKQMSLASDNNATGLLTSQMTTSNQLFGNDNANWIYENGLYPRLADMDDSDLAVLHATPIFLNGDETVASVFSNFNVSVLPDGIQWTSSNATEGLTVTIAQIAADGLKAVSFEGTGSFNLTATLGTASRTVKLRIPHVFEITSAAQLAHLSYILSDDVEWSDDGYPWVDANGVPLEDGHLVPPYAFDTYFKLMNDISLAAICGEGVGNWQPIGYDGFMGHFNGNGHTISDLYINDEESASQALFGGVDDGSISNLTVEGSVKAESYVAGICVYLNNNGTLTNCHNAVALSAYDEYSYAGGVCVENYGTISNCSNSAHLEAFNVGGVCQENSGRIDHCYNAGTIEGSYIGGICSYNNDGTTISNCYNVGTLTGAEEVYGIAYNGWSSTITDCFNAGTLSGGSVYGIGYGYDDSYFTNCYNTGALFGDEYVAAICNSAEDGGGSGPSKGNNNVTNCFYDKQICTATDADATGLLTSEMTSGNSIFGAGNSNWIYTENFYPLLAGMNETDAALVAAAPIFLDEEETVNSIFNASFTVSTANGVAWSSDSDIATVNGNTVTLNGSGNFVLTASLNGVEKHVTFKIPIALDMTHPFAEDFNESNNFEILSLEGVNHWTVGTECGPVDGKALYVTDGENGYFYDEYTYSFSMASLNMNVAAGAYEISYDWKGVAESQYDFLRVVLLPADADFNYEDIDYDELPDNCIPLDGMHGLSGASTWQTNNVEFVVTENGSYNLLVVWMNDGSYSNGIPAAVDNINIVGVACPRPTGLTASVEGYSVTLDWDDNDNATGWEYAYSMTEGTPTAAGTPTENNTANFTVAEAGIYYAYVRASYSDGYSQWASCKFVVVDFDGSGTESEPYQIYDREDMDMLSDAVNAGVPFEGQCFKVMNDINLGGEENPWTPIGWYDYDNDVEFAFSGSFDGNGKTISGLYVDSENNYQGLFGYVAYSSILNLTVEGEVHGGEYQIGGICGWSDYATFKNCVSNVEVTGIEDVAGICGGSGNITIENCVNNGNVNGVKYWGGIVGFAYGDNIVKNCANNAPVIAEQPEGEVWWGYDVGGICGYVEGTVSNSYNAGMVVGNYDCGPICGKIYGTITNCYFDTDMCSGFEDYEDENVIGAPSSDFTSGILPYGFDSDVWYAVPGSYPRLIDNDHVMALPVMAYEEEEVVRDGEPFGGWYLVASPMVNSITPSVNNGLLNDPEDADFDLYGFNIRESGEEWCNVKDESNEIVVMNGKGYLVANGKNTVVRFTGDFHAEEEVVVSGISGWGLVGNPLGTVATVSCDYYKMNANHSELVLCEAGTTVNPGEAIFVNSSSVTFTPANASAPVSSPMLNLNLSNAENGLIDRASIRFGEGKSLDKFMLDEANTQLYMPQGEKRYAVVATNAKAVEMPVNFKAEKQGSYTLSVEMKDVTPGSLRLIDKLTGADIDLLATPSYTFMASPSDSAERFTVVIR